jgi:DNA-binding MarR family transcriptional regulator
MGSSLSAGVADGLRVTLALLVRRLRQTRDDSLSIPEVSALARLESLGPATLTQLARAERISAQSLGATIDGLERRGLAKRRADERDGRQSFVSITAKGRSTLRSRRSGRSAHLARTLAAQFTEAELAQLEAALPLLERLANAL